MHRIPDEADSPTVVDSELTERLMVFPAPGRHRAEQPLEFAPSIRYGAAAIGLMAAVVAVWYGLSSGPAEVAVRQPLPGTVVPYPPPATTTPDVSAELVTETPKLPPVTATPVRRPTPLRRMHGDPSPVPRTATTRPATAREPTTGTPTSTVASVPASSTTSAPTSTRLTTEDQP